MSLGVRSADTKASTTLNPRSPMARHDLPPVPEHAQQGEASSLSPSPEPAPSPRAEAPPARFACYGCDPENPCYGC